MTGRFKKFVSIIISLMVVCSAFGLYASAGNTALSEYSYALSPTEGYIGQSINEYGYYYAVLGVKNAGTYTRSIYGYWSPDSNEF